MGRRNVFDDLRGAVQARDEGVRPHDAQELQDEAGRLADDDHAEEVDEEARNRNSTKEQHVRTSIH